MIKTFYAILTERDCSLQHAEKYGNEPHGPLLYECYLNEEAAKQEAVAERSKRFADHGWVRVAQVIVDITGDER